MDCRLPGSCVHGDSPGKNTGVGCYFLLQDIFPTQESNRSLMQLLPPQVDSFTTELRRGSFESHKWLYVKMKVTTSIYLPLPCIMEKAMATHSSTLAWKIPWMEEPDRLQSMGSLRVGHDWATSLSLFTFMHWRRKWQPTPVLLPGESQGREPGGKTKYQQSSCL